MATNITIRSNVKENLSKYSRNTIKGIKREIAIAGLNVERNAKKFAPVLTGRLRASIRPLSRSGDGLSIRVGTNVTYAAKQEQRQPFLLPAANIERARFNKRIAKILNKVK